MQYTRRFEAAVVFATQLHDGHFRKGTDVPYITHLMAVASLVGEAGGTEDEVIAALLHDAVEDRGGQPTLERIRDLFGSGVAAIVEGCSDTDVVPKPPWKERKEAYIRHLKEASPSVLLVSCADKLHNARALVADFAELGDELWKRFNASRGETLWYYRELVESFKLLRVPVRLAMELDRTVQLLEEAVRGSS